LKPSLGFFNAFSQPPPPADGNGNYNGNYPQKPESDQYTRLVHAMTFRQHNLIRRGSAWTRGAVDIFSYVGPERRVLHNPREMRSTYRPIEDRSSAALEWLWD
jgi:hypothetical protein